MSLDSQLVTVDALAILDQVRSRIREESLAPKRGSAVRFYFGHFRGWNALTAGELRSCASQGAVPDSTAPDQLAEIALRLQALQTSLNSGIESAIPHIGASPPRAGTLRGLFGAIAIRVLQRLLWWYTRSLRAFAEVLGDQFQSELEAIKSLACDQTATRDELAALRDEVSKLRASMSGRATDDR